MDADRFLKEFHDFLAPRLDTYEQAIYLYAVRHSRLVGEREVGQINWALQMIKSQPESETN